MTINSQIYAVFHQACVVDIRESEPSIAGNQCAGPCFGYAANGRSVLFESKARFISAWQCVDSSSDRESAKLLRLPGILQTVQQVEVICTKSW